MNAVAVAPASSTITPPQNNDLRDIVAVVGTTGVGKSQLAVDLALALSELHKQAEVINFDSMQVYRCLDVITNKASGEEMRGVPHHLMDFLEPGQEYQINDFQRDAMSKIDDMHGKDVVPILVGGTTYYLQHLVFPNQLVSDAPPSRSIPPPDTQASERIATFPPSLRDAVNSLPPELLELFLLVPSLPSLSSPDTFPSDFPIDSLPAQYRVAEAYASGLYAALSHVDPASASRWHWRDVRKVRRAIDIVWEGRRWQDVLDAQKAREGIGPRYRTLIFWLYSEPALLEQRLDFRVEAMLNRGLLAEIEGLRRLKAETSEDYTHGIYQAIGYKEFSEFLDLKARDPSITIEHGSFRRGVEEMKTSTRQYARRQVKWIKKKLLPAVAEHGRADVSLFLLDATDLAQWSTEVKEKALDIMQTFLKNETLPDPKELSPMAADLLAPVATKTAEDKEKRRCEVCTLDPSKPFMVDAWQFDLHHRSRTHRRNVRSKIGARRREIVND